MVIEAWIDGVVFGCIMGSLVACWPSLVRRVRLGLVVWGAGCPHNRLARVSGILHLLNGKPFNAFHTHYHRTVLFDIIQSGSIFVCVVARSVEAAGRFSSSKE